jgi:hypothetical protein
MADRLLVVREVAHGRDLRADLNAALRERLRSRLGRDPLPSAGGLADSQTAKSTGVGGEQRGYDGQQEAQRQEAASAR